MSCRWGVGLAGAAAAVTLACGGDQGPSGGLNVRILIPATAVVGTPSVQLTVRGAGFGTKSVVLWNGSPVTTAAQSDTEVVAFLGDTQLRHPGISQVAVRDETSGARSASAPFTVRNPVPTITGVSPSELTAGRGAVTLTVTGSGLFGYTRFRWNGAERPTAFVDGELLVDLGASDVANAQLGELVAVNTEPGGGSSAPAKVPVVNPRTILSQRALQLQANALLADRARQRVYAAVAAGDATYPSSVATVDPVAGTIVGAIPLPFEPNLLTLSGDGRYLYVASTDGPAVSRIDLTAGQIDLAFTVAGFAQYEPSAVGDFAVVPGEPAALAVAIRSLAVTPDHEGYVVFDNGVARAGRTGRALRSNFIRPSDQAGELYGVAENGISALFRLQVTAAGIQVAETVNLPGARGLDFAIEGRRLISDAGTDVDLATRQIRKLLNLQVGAFAFDLAANRYYWMIAGVPTLRAYDLGTALSVGPVAIGGTGSPRPGLARWSRDGFAFRTFTQVILVRTNQVDP